MRKCIHSIYCATLSEKESGHCKPLLKFDHVNLLPLATRYGVDAVINAA